MSYLITVVSMLVLLLAAIAVSMLSLSSQKATSSTKVVFGFVGGIVLAIGTLFLAKYVLGRLY